MDASDPGHSGYVYQIALWVCLSQSEEGRQRTPRALRIRLAGSYALDGTLQEGGRVVIDPAMPRWEVDASVAETRVERASLCHAMQFGDLVTQQMQQLPEGVCARISRVSYQH